MDITITIPDEIVPLVQARADRISKFQPSVTDIKSLIQFRVNGVIRDSISQNATSKISQTDLTVKVLAIVEAFKGQPNITPDQKAALDSVLVSPADANAAAADAVDVTPILKP